MTRLTDDEVRKLAAAQQYGELKTLERVIRMLQQAGEHKAAEVVRTYWMLIKPDWWRE